MNSLSRIRDYEVSTGSAFKVFPRFRKGNYFTWNANIKITLGILNQWKVIPGELTGPVQVALNTPSSMELELEEAWELRKQCAYSERALHIEDELRGMTMLTEDPKVAWDSLKEVYGTGLANSRMALMSELMRLRYEGAGILEFKSQMDAIRLKLLDARQEIKEQDYLNILMNALPEEFNIMITID